jgi:hypothetical protein
MKLGICSIQRDRGPWIREWIAFHYMIGFKKYYIYLHRCTDNSIEEVIKLKKIFDIECFQLGAEIFRPQLIAYQHAYLNYSHEVDWLDFIDGDEFIYPTKENNIIEDILCFQYEKLSSLAIWWRCFGSFGHINEPNALIIENYTKRPPLDFTDNKDIKSVARGFQGDRFSVLNNSHYFQTILGKKDESLRVVDSGFVASIHPSYKKISIIHYVCQSLEYFKKFKQNSGTADAGAESVRPVSWWTKHDVNEVEDRDIQRFLPKLKTILKGI